MTSAQKTLIVIAGPTAVGKTAAAVALAKHYKTVVVSADSRQFYREMSIGTAKPTIEEQGEVKHYFIDSLSISDPFTAGDYEKQSLSLLDDLFKVYHVVLLVGGSGLFIKAVCDGFDTFPEVDPGVREKLNKEFEEGGIDALTEKLKIADPDYFKEVDSSNPHRVIRALEVFESTGRPYSSFRRSTENERPFRIIKLGLTMERSQLYHRINQRVDDMVKQGLVEEAKSLLLYRNLNALKTVGYNELFDYFDGNIDLGIAVELIKQNTRRFAKRQLTWFRKDEAIIWFNAANANLLSEIQPALDMLMTAQ